MNWISVKDKLPEPNKYVFIRHCLTNWKDPDHQSGVQYDVAKFVRGISLEERKLMKEGKLPSSKSSGWCLSDGWKEHERWQIYRSEDEHGNNSVPYDWETFGPMKYFGQDVTHWMPIPEIEVVPRWPMPSKSVR